MHLGKQGMAVLRLGAAVTPLPTARPSQMSRLGLVAQVSHGGHLVMHTHDSPIQPHPLSLPCCRLQALRTCNVCLLRLSQAALCLRPGLLQAVVAEPRCLCTCLSPRRSLPPCAQTSS